MSELDLKKNLKPNTSIILKKKLNRYSINRLKHIDKDWGNFKHYPPATQEWYNSIYTFNKNYLKTLSTLDKNIINLLKGFVSIFIHHKVLNIKYVSLLSRRRSIKKIFLSKGELKHTNSKVTITFYIYNPEKIFLMREYLELCRELYPHLKYAKLKNRRQIRITYLKTRLYRFIFLDLSSKIIKDIKGDKIVGYNRPYTLKEFLDSSKYSKIKTKIKRIISNSEAVYSTQINFCDIYYSIIISFIDQLNSYLVILKQYYEYLTNLVNIRILTDYDKFLIFLKKAGNFYTYNYPNYKSYKIIAEDKYAENLYRLRYLLTLNNIKFEKPFMVKLINIVEKLYNKKVEFNIVDLKKVHLNSDIFTQAVALKLKNRNNGLFYVLRSAFNKVKLSKSTKLSDIGVRLKKTNSDRSLYLINRTRNTYFSEGLKNSNEDIFSILLFNLFPYGNKLNNNKLSSKYTIPLKNLIVKNLKHLKLSGVRLEAKGRLTRRYKSARLVFKLKWKGGLKNVDSSFKGLSTVMLRGNTRSNVQYSKLSSKRRIGAFGVKGWVGSR